MTWAAVAVAGGALLGGMMGSSSAKKAQRAQEAAARESIAEERRQFDVNRADLAPYREAGTESVGRLRDLLGIGSSTMTPAQLMEQDPGYQFGLDEGNKAIMNAARASGMSQSPSTVKGLMRYGQDYATQRFGDIYNRFAGLAGTGQSAAFGGAQLGSGSTGRIGDMMTGLGNARGASAIAQGNAWGGAAQNIGNYYAQNQFMNRMFPQGGGNQTPTWMQGYRNPMSTVTN